MIILSEFLSSLLSCHPFYTFFAVSSSVNSVFFHKDGNCVISGSSDKTIKMWDIRSHLLIQHYAAHDSPVSSISLHESGYYLLSASRDSSMRIWDLREGRLLFTLQSHTGPVNSAVFSKDGNFFASGGTDELVMVWKSNLFDVKCPEINWGTGEKPRSEATITNATGTVIRSKQQSQLPTPPPMSASSATKTKSTPPRQRLTPSRHKNVPGDSEVVPPPAPSSLSKLTSVRKNRPPSTSPTRLRSTSRLSASSTVSTSNENSFEHSSAERKRRQSPSSSSLISRDQLPPTLTKTLDHIIGQVSYVQPLFLLLLVPSFFSARYYHKDNVNYGRTINTNRK
jgi:hypothetical protein